MGNIFKIGEAAKKLGLTVNTLQRLDREGRLIPARSETGRRYYTDRQLIEFLRDSSNSEITKNILMDYLSKND